MNGWNPWKVTSIAMMVAMVMALVTGLVVANWTGEREVPTPERQAAKPEPAAKPARVVAKATAPTQSVIDACNRQAAADAKDTKDKTVEVVKDAAIGAMVGAAVGAAGGAIADGGKGAGKGAAIGGLVGAGGGTLYGLNENKKSDERYRAAYANCMRARGHTS